jgi:chromosome segregation ATPase
MTPSKPNTTNKNKFYDEALEARTNQLEEAENELNKIKGEIELVRKSEMDLKSKNESFKFDNEMLSKRIESTSQDKTNVRITRVLFPFLEKGRLSFL